MKQKILSSILLCLMLSSIIVGLPLTRTLPAANPLDRGFSTYTWEDDFLDPSLIDMNLSSGIQLQNGNVSMQDTYPAWVAYPDWQRLRPLFLNNTNTTITNSVIKLTIPYDGSMQTDFDDLRFASTNGTPLLYNRIAKIDTVSATVLVRIPSLPHGLTTIYLFYKNPDATDGSNPVLTWTKVTSDDVRISYVGPTEGCWDPAVAHGSNQFLVTWEEGLPPRDSADEGHRLLLREIHGRMYNGQGGDPQPPNPDGDILISPTSSAHAENPSVAYSPQSTYYFVTWEENPLYARYAIGIHAAIVRSTDHWVYTPIVVDNPLYDAGQYYPCRNPSIAYDDSSHRFLIVYSKSDINSNVDLYGRLYTSVGTAVGSAFAIVSGIGYQGQPFVTSDHNGHFLVTYENGTSGTSGPLSIRSVLLNSNGAPVSAFYTLEQGTSSIDCIYPASVFSTEAQEYLVAWNTGDISGSDFNGRIDAILMTTDGNPVDNYFTVKSSNLAEVASVAPYFSTNFIVSYDYSGKVYGRMVTSSGAVIENEQTLVDTLSSGADFSVLSVNGTKLFAIWEDERYGYYTEVFGSIWRIDQTMASPDVNEGSEAQRILDATITSVQISPQYFQSWKKFGVIRALNNGSFNFRIVNASGALALKSYMSDGEDISGIIAPVIRVQALFHRDVASTTPTIDYWNITARVGGDLDAPWTNLSVLPTSPVGQNGWYIGPVHIMLESHDNDSPPQNVTTYYRIDGGETMNYTQPFNVTTEQANNSVEFWSVDRAGNEELPHHIFSGIDIDGTAPTVNVLGPPLVIFPGLAEVTGSSIEFQSGSGIDELRILLNDEEVYHVSFLQQRTANISWNFTAKVGDSYDIKIQSIDHAGNIGLDRRLVSVSEYGLYIPGYIYWFDYPKIGPVYQLAKLDMAAVINYDALHVVLHTIPEHAVYAKFVATRQMLGINYSFYDRNLSDGASYEMPLPHGVYRISVTLYDLQDHPLDTQILIYKVFVYLLKTK
jgi:hypothetical protein